MKPSSPRRIGIVCNKDRPSAPQWLRVLIESIHQISPASQCLVSRDCESFLDDKDPIVFSLGGDGTVLSAARAIYRSSSNASLIGVNLGKLGFITEFQPEEIPVVVKELFAGELLEESRLVVQAAITSEGQTRGVRVQRTSIEGRTTGISENSISLAALNEIVVDNYGSTRMLTFELRVDGALLGIMRSDGLIVATPTGSTGYAVSAGGPIIEPTSPVLLITPIAPHSLNVRPIVVPASSHITVRASSDETKEALIVADGQDEVVVEAPALVEISAASKRITLLRRKENSYFDRLRTKLLWSIDARDTQGLRR